jgi:hypothetical protein
MRTEAREDGKLDNIPTARKHAVLLVMKQISMESVSLIGVQSN